MEAKKMQTTLKPKYLVTEKGQKKAVILDIKEYEDILELIESLEDANDLLKAEREAVSFIPYDKFRKQWLKN
jgi:PHD/YefM family antitoxin component YafN of YafNO toxin-antitoxin module